MKKEEVMPFTGKDVRLVFSNGYAIDGKITEIIDDTVFFQLSDTISSINLWDIALIVLKR